MAGPPGAMIRLAPDLDLPFPPLADDGGRGAQLYGAISESGGPGVTLRAADRYGYGREVWRAAEADALPPPDAPLDRIAFAELEDCGCGLPAWPEDAMEATDS